MSGRARIEQICKVLKVEEKKMRDQVVHLHGQILYNQRMQEILNQQLCELIGEEAAKVEIDKSVKSKTTKRTKNK